MTQIYIKQNIHKHQTQNFEELVPSVSPLLKKHIRLVSWTIPSIYQYQIFKKHKRGMDRSNKKKLHKCITANTSAIYGSMLHIPLTNFLLLAA